MAIIFLFLLIAGIKTSNALAFGESQRLTINGEIYNVKFSSANYVRNDCAFWVWKGTADSYTGTAEREKTGDLLTGQDYNFATFPLKLHVNSCAASSTMAQSSASVSLSASSGGSQPRGCQEAQCSNHNSRWCSGNEIRQCTYNSATTCWKEGSAGSCEFGCENGQCKTTPPPQCDYTRRCFGKYVYECRMSSGGFKQEFEVQLCPYDCQNGACAGAPTSHYTKNCNTDGNVWWIDSAGNFESIAQSCSNGCASAQCKSSPACGTYRACYSNRPWYFNSCTNQPETPLDTCNYEVENCVNGWCERKATLANQCSSGQKECLDKESYRECIYDSTNNYYKWKNVAVYCPSNYECSNNQCIYKPTEYCGNGKCDSNEYCSNCPQDCGVCQPTCTTYGLICLNNSYAAYQKSDCSISNQVYCPYGCGNGECADKPYTTQTQAVKTQTTQQANPSEEGQWYPGNLHVHTEFSTVDLGCQGEDFHGIDSPIRKSFDIQGYKNLLKNYLNFDYFWMGISDHSYCIDENKWNQIKKEADSYTDDNFVFLPGEEVEVIEKYSGPVDCPGDWVGGRSLAHLGAYGITSFIEPNKSNSYCPTQWPNSEEGIAAVEAQGGLAIINHPFYAFSDKNADWRDFEKETGYDGLEIWNGAGNGANFKKECENDYSTFISSAASEIDKVKCVNTFSFVSWIRLIRAGKKVYAYGGTDFHEKRASLSSLEMSDLMPYNYAFMKPFNEPSLLDALKNGRVVVSNNGLIFFTIKEILKENPDVYRIGEKNACINQNTKIKIEINYSVESPCEMLLYKGNLTENKEMAAIRGRLASTYLYDNLEGSVVFEDDVTGPSYYRIVCHADGGTTTHPLTGQTVTWPQNDKWVITNPIWINTSNYCISDLDKASSRQTQTQNTPPTQAINTQPTNKPTEQRWPIIGGRGFVAGRGEGDQSAIEQMWEERQQNEGSQVVVTNPQGEQTSNGGIILTDKPRACFFWWCW